jgi:hypothetical protein
MYQNYSGGRVGGVRPPYRDHHVSKSILISGGLDTPRHASTAPTAPLSATGLLDQRGVL